ncbi:endonuclease/exonuclease/phosphatase family protein [Georgenia sp. TF02-10]|uniref:endonuclease/exonuclease/phosphatase family protein n=1 Tax=Georgenia sp. TF02-10 TaxID=2917725 RepID=UPI001FA74CAE|nr:endonuclease/exonuclease/phosphatase family protein [Georgenia sp. TF02-10]UNX54540.1 endonuclease/exonuclease/phosphatase family protein [Georgenia sp. TF02-10]
MRLRLLTLNLQHGKPAVGSPRAGEPASAGVLHDLAAEIAPLDPDVVLLQEVDRRQRRSGGVDQAAVLAADLGLPFWRFAPAFAGWVGGLRVPPRRWPGAWLRPAPARRRGAGWLAGGAPAYGVALLSRVPVASWHLLPLGGARLQVRPGGRPGRWMGGWAAASHEGRACLAAVLQTAAGPVTVAVTHFSVDPATARSQLRRCTDAVATLPGPAVLGGDLNLQPADVAAATALTPLAQALTFTNARPRRQIDHLLGSGVRAADGGRAHHFSVSDHAGLAADIVLP